MVSKTENLAYHASRLLLLIFLCGKPRNRSGKSEILPGIEGRTLLAKLDFFIRYPAYLKRAMEILGLEVSDTLLEVLGSEESSSVESQMVRYLYGPWDHAYYSVLAYLIGKGLIEVERSAKRGTETFRLTEKGEDIIKKIVRSPIYEDLVLRADATYHTFNKYTGNSLKDFIYNNFPEVVGRDIGKII